MFFFVMYHYKTNAIFATPIPGLDSKSVLAAYAKNFEYLVSQGYTPKINIMDNQAKKVIKAYLKPQDVTLQLVEPHNHRVNAAECTIQTFKNRFRGALGTTDTDLTVQLWNKLSPQVQDLINLLCRSRIKPNVSAYEALEGPYDWNRYPIAPLGTKANIFEEDSDTRASWAPHGLNAWILGPLKDHYRCHLFYIPETRGYRILGSANLFPQHCMVPKYTPKSHVKDLSKVLQINLEKLACKHCNINVMKMLARHLNAYITGTLLPAPGQALELRAVVLPTQRMSNNANPPTHPDI